MATKINREMSVKVEHQYLRFNFDNIADADAFAEQMIKTTKSNTEEVEVEARIIYTKEVISDPNETTYIAEDIINKAEAKEETDHQHIEDLMPEEEGNNYEQFV